MTVKQVMFVMATMFVAGMGGLLLIASHADDDLPEGSMPIHKPTRMVLYHDDGTPSHIFKTYDGPVEELRGAPMIILLNPGQTEAQGMRDFEAGRAKQATSFRAR